MSEAAYGLTGDFIFKEAVEFLKKKKPYAEKHARFCRVAFLPDSTVASLT